MNKRPAAAVTLGLALVAACAAPPEASVDVAAETAALIAAAEAYDAAAASLDPDVIATFYVAESMAYPPNEPTVAGRDGFREYAAAFVSAPGIEMSMGDVEAVVAASGDFGYTYSEGDVSFDGEDGERITDTLRDFHMWKKDAAGEWKVVVDIWNSPNPLPGG